MKKPIVVTIFAGLAIVLLVFLILIMTGVISMPNSTELQNISFANGNDTTSGSPTPLSPSMQIARSRNILIIGVEDTTNSNVQIEAVWLIVFHFDIPIISLFPIFPENSEDFSTRDYELAAPFRFTQEGMPNENFWNEIEDRQILWHNYVLIDEKAVNAITDLLDVPRGRDSGYLIHWVDDSQASLYGQIFLFDQACKSFSQHDQIEDISTFIKNLVPHLSTDIPIDQTVADWQLLRAYGESLRCEFPTLTVATP